MTSARRPAPASPVATGSEPASPAAPASPRAHMRRRRLATRAAMAAAAGWLAAGCASPPPPARWLHWPTQATQAPASAGRRAEAAQGVPVWQLMALAPLPEPLDRPEVWLSEGPARLRALPGWRWAEPLRDALPRLLLADLDQWRGAGSVWAAPLPPGLVVQRQLRVQLVALDNLPGTGQVRLQLRWSLADPSGASPPGRWDSTLQVPWPDGQAETLASAQRQALWLMAGEIARSAAP